MGRLTLVNHKERKEEHESHKADRKVGSTKNICGFCILLCALCVATDFPCGC